MASYGQSNVEDEDEDDVDQESSGSEGGELPDELKEQLWTTPATDAVHINLTRDGKRLFDEDIHPPFTYTIFGEDEIIPGYKDLVIRLDFRAHDLRPKVAIEHGLKMKAINEDMENLMDINGLLSSYLPDSAFAKDEDAQNDSAASDESTWSPPGELFHSYSVDKRKFEVWIAPLTDKRAFEMIKNMHILIPFFIEGGTVGILDEPEWSLERWKLFLLYEVDSAASTFTLAGFSTSYRVTVLPGEEVKKMAVISNTSPPSPPFSPTQESMPESISPLDLLSRERISQFIILPPFQGSSHGSWLYNAMVSRFRSDPSVFEITVEEPNEQFDALRDHCDLAYLSSQKPDFLSLSLPSNLKNEQLARTAFVPDMNPQDTLFALRAASKIAPRQFTRLVEIYLLGHIPAYNRNMARQSRKGAAVDEKDRKYYFWRLMVKERLFIRNKDQLIQVEPDERVEALEKTMGGVVDEYTDRLREYEKRVGRGLMAIVESFCGKMSGQSVANGEKASSSRKRKVIDDDEDDDGEEEKPAKKGKTPDPMARLGLAG